MSHGNSPVRLVLGTGRYSGSVYRVPVSRTLLFIVTYVHAKLYRSHELIILLDSLLISVAQKRCACRLLKDGNLLVLCASLISLSISVVFRISFPE
jgi:hypothetical protein